MTDPTEALFCVKPDGHSGPHAGWIGGEWSVRDNWTDLRHPPIEQAAEAVDREAAGAARDSERTRTSAAAAPLEPIPTDWGVGPLTHPAAVAPWYCPECGGVVLHDKPAAVAVLDVERLTGIVAGIRERNAAMGRLTARGEAEVIAAAYDDAIRKRGGA